MPFAEPKQQGAIVRAFAFDLGKVLLEFDYANVARRLAAQCEGGPTAVMAELRRDGLAERLEMGRLSSTEFFSEFKRGTGYRGGFEDFARAWSDIFHENTPMVELMRRLKRK